MDNWFTVEEIDDKTYAISEYKHWEESHSYLIIGSQKSLLIDTGLGIGNIHDVVTSLTSLPIMVATTHAHWDHIGGHKYFKEIAVHEAEIEWLNGKFPIPLKLVMESLLKDPCEIPECFYKDQYEIYQEAPSHILHNNDVIDLGNRYIQVIHTPGHSPGHICLYEKENKYLYTGDLIYEGTLDAFYPSTSPYEFMMSVRRLKELDISRILPAHHKLEIKVNLIDEIDRAFNDIFRAGKLNHGSGIYSYDNFSIHI